MKSGWSFTGVCLQTVRLTASSSNGVRTQAANVRGVWGGARLGRSTLRARGPGLEPFEGRQRQRRTLPDSDVLDVRD